MKGRDHCSQWTCNFRDVVLLPCPILQFRKKTLKWSDNCPRALSCLVVRTRNKASWLVFWCSFHNNMVVEITSAVINDTKLFHRQVIFQHKVLKKISCCRTSHSSINASVCCESHKGDSENVSPTLGNPSLCYSK